MIKNVALHSQQIISIIKNAPITSQWVIYTPTFSIASIIEYHDDTIDESFEIISGAHTHRFKAAIEGFKSKHLRGLIISYEQTLNKPKFEIIMDCIKHVDVFIIDAMYRRHMDSLYYSVELECMIQHLNIIQPQNLHLIQPDEADRGMKAFYHTLSLPSQIQLIGGHLLQCVERVKTKKVLWVTQSWIQANQVSSWLKHDHVDHALIHKKVDEATKIEMQDRYIEGHLSHAITTYDTALPLNIQGIQYVIFTFNIQTDHMIRFFMPYVDPQDVIWNIMPWFEQQDYISLAMPFNQNMFDFIHHVMMIEGGCSMREAERSLNIDSYEFEKIIKFLKGRSIIRKEGLNYVIDHHHAIPSLYEIAIDETCFPLTVPVMQQNTDSLILDEGIIFEFFAKKIMPVGFYEFATIPDSLKHEPGVVCTSVWTYNSLSSWITQQNLDGVIFMSQKQELMHQLSHHVVCIDASYLNVDSLHSGKNPYQRVKHAKDLCQHLPSLDLSHMRRVGIILDAYDDGWSSSVISITIKQHAPHCDVIPLCLSF